MCSLGTGGAEPLTLVAHIPGPYLPQLTGLVEGEHLHEELTRLNAPAPACEMQRGVAIVILAVHVERPVRFGVEKYVEKHGATHDPVQNLVWVHLA